MKEIQPTKLPKHKRPDISQLNVFGRYERISKQFFNPFFLREERWYMLNTLVQTMLNRDLTQKGVEELQEIISYGMRSPRHPEYTNSQPQRKLINGSSPTVDEAYQQIEDIFLNSDSSRTDRYTILAFLISDMSGLDFSESDARDLEGMLDNVMTQPYMAILQKDGIY
jgi:hypothetical protein